MATLEEMVDKAIQVAVLRAHPVGSYFITESADNPHEILGGGVWQKLEGRFLLGANASYSVGSEGGEAMHTLTENELPKIDGSWRLHGQENGSLFYTLYGHATGNLIASKYQSFQKVTATNANSYGSPGFAFGGGASHNNMPPYRAVNIWRRTA